MPYTTQHKQYLEAMGLVPWVHRKSMDAAVATESATQTQSPLLESLYKEGTALVHGEPSANLLLMFQVASDQSELTQKDTNQTNLTQTNLTLNSSDNRLLLDMLKAIGLDESDVARCLVRGPITPAVFDAICSAVNQPLSAALLMVTEAPDINSDDQQASRFNAEKLRADTERADTEGADAERADAGSTKQSAVPVWRMPHPSWIQQQPSLKRRAWNVLKAVRATLNDQVGV